MKLQRNLRGRSVSQTSNAMPKRVARVAAVQFMYEMEMGDKKTPSDKDLEEFVETYVEERINFSFFKKLIDDLQKDADFAGIVNNVLEDGKTISNSPPVEICIIKTALAEMIFEKTDIPVIINEYVEIAKDFLDQKAAKFINALLDKISKTVERRCQTKA